MSFKPMTHRKSIIIALVVIAETALVLSGLALFRADLDKTILLALIGVASNIVSVLAGGYIGKTKEDTPA